MGSAPTKPPRAGRAGRSPIAAAAALCLALCQPAAARTIVVDAGHGGHDRGGIPGQAVAEKTVALDVAVRLRSSLARRGFRSVMTRTGDYFVPLSARVLAANRAPGGVLVSVHFNSSRNPDASGIETFYHKRHSAALAAAIQRRVVAVARTPDRGVKRRAFFVLRKTRGPAVLVECGFLTNRHEARKALSPAHRQRLADAIADGVAARF